VCTDLFLIESFVCNCDGTGFGGATCNIDLNPTPTPLCDPNPCLHGFCSQSGYSITCSCSVGWAGHLCSVVATDLIPIDSVPQLSSIATVEARFSYDIYASDPTFYAGVIREDASLIANVTQDRIIVVRVFTVNETTVVPLAQSFDVQNRHLLQLDLNTFLHIMLAITPCTTNCTNTTQTAQNAAITLVNCLLGTTCNTNTSIPQVVILKPVNTQLAAITTPIFCPSGFALTTDHQIACVRIDAPTKTWAEALGGYWALIGIAGLGIFVVLGVVFYDSVKRCLAKAQSYSPFDATTNPSSGELF
jgi:hypothetical protein